MKYSKGFWIFVVLVLLCLLAIPLHFGVFRVQIPARFSEQLFHNFTEKYNKTYLNPQEFQKRLGIFRVSKISLYDPFHGNIIFNCKIVVRRHLLRKSFE